MSKLFRQEAVDAKRDACFGRVQITQSLPAKVVVVAGVVMLAVGIAYAVLGNYTRRVNATGIILPRDGLLNLSSTVAGIVATTAAAEGQKVKKGQLLFVIDREANSVTGPTVRRAIESLTHQKALLQQQRDLRKVMAGAEKEALQTQILNEEAQHVELAQQIAANEESLRRLKAKGDQLAAANRSHIVTDSAFQSQNTVYLEVFARQEAAKQNYLQTEGRIAQAKATLADLDNKTQQSLNEIDQNILTVEQQIAENEAQQSIYVLAPADGILTALLVHVGQGVDPNTTLVTVLPSSGTMEAHLFVDSSAIAILRVGAPVLLRYAAFPFQKFGLYKGTVTEITLAPVSQDTSQSGAPSGTAEGIRSASEKGSLYRVVVTPQLPYVLAEGKQQKLEAGMRVEASIALDRRHLYEWVFEPLYQVQRSVRIITGADTP
ncbi:MAG: HlyD family secretion protein [Pseudomonadota bacterium]|nr:HlyD family secretion protein [Pseudomonadota bacterium]